MKNVSLELLRIMSLLDTDFYTFTMAQVVLNQYPTTHVKYKFKCRNPKDLYAEKDAEFYKYNLNIYLNELCKITFCESELQFLHNTGLFKASFIDYLRGFRLQKEYIDITVCNNELQVVIEGPWISTIWFEVPLLSAISELYCDKVGVYDKESLLKDLNKIKFLKDFKFSDFGTRRRCSYADHLNIIQTLKNEVPNKLVGTSNVYMAYLYKLKPIGTMSHQYICAHQQLNCGIEESQRVSLENWAKEYRGNLGIALSDTLTFNKFCNDFDLYFAKLFDGCRHDSGCPYWWCETLINHYKQLKIDPKTKQAIFSDGLDFDKAIKLYRNFNDQIQTSFGIGTNLTNRLPITPPNIVIKMVECNNRPVAKISDSEGKGMCEDENYLNYLHTII